MRRDDSTDDAPLDAPRVLGRGALRVAGLGTIVVAWSARGVTTLDQLLEATRMAFELRARARDF